MVVDSLASESDDHVTSSKKGKPAVASKNIKGQPMEIDSDIEEIQILKEDSEEELGECAN